MDLPIPPQVVYAGLAGVVLALIVATATNKWKAKVFFLLALRLAIGWHFFFEGAHKIHSHMVGPIETSKPFSSEPYFTVADGPFGEVMRTRMLGDTDALIAAKVTPDPDKVAGFAKLSEAEQAALCPKPVAELLEKAALDGLKDKDVWLKEVEEYKAQAAKVKETAKPDELKNANEAAAAKAAAAEKAARPLAEAADLARARVAVALADKKPEAAAAQAAAKAAEAAAEAARKDYLAAKAAAEKADKDWAAAKKKVSDTLAKGDVTALKLRSAITQAEAQKAAYARWVYGVDRRDAKVKYFGSDVPQSAGDRLGHIKKLSDYYESLKARQGENLGTGYGNELKRTAAAKADLRQAKAELLADADAFIADLVKTTGGKLPDPEPKPLVFMDKVTMWTITLVGAFLLFGFLTPVACVVGAGFLLLTYLSHPTVPWLPLPPGTEGNPLFINKNLIEMLALLVIAAHPTGRWLGLDAVLCRLFCKN